jgi:hypothetical protein
MKIPIVVGGGSSVEKSAAPRFSLGTKLHRRPFSHALFLLSCSLGNNVLQENTADGSI